MAWYNDVWDFITGQSAKTYTNLAKTGIAALSSYASFKDQQKKNQMQQDAYDDYMAQAESAGHEARAAIDINYTPMTVSGVPTTKADVTDFTAVAAKGGLMSIPTRQRKRYARGPDEVEVMEMDEESITPFGLQQETGIDLTGEQVRAPGSAKPRETAWSVWNSGAIDQQQYEFDFEIFFQSGDWMDMFKGETPVQGNMQMASAYSDDDLQAYENYKYTMEEQMPGMPIMEIDDWLRMEHGAAKLGVRNGGIIGLRHGGRPGYKFGDEVEVLETDEEVITPFDLKNEEGVPIQQMVGGGDRGWRAQMLAEELAEEQYGMEFYDLPQRKQIEVYQIALDMIDSQVRGSGDPEQPPIYLPKPGDTPKKMASAPTLEDSINDMAMNMFNKPYHQLNESEIEALNEYNSGLMAKGGRIGYAMGPGPVMDNTEGGIMDLGGMEKDYRFNGGFVPIGEYEKKDDVPARLSKNEFVFTADAVRAAGGGSINKGAKRMYETMKNLEAKPEAKRMTA